MRARPPTPPGGGLVRLDTAGPFRSPALAGLIHGSGRPLPPPSHRAGYDGAYPLRSTVNRPKVEANCCRNSERARNSTPAGGR
jgi:hypothetical protein